MKSYSKIVLFKTGFKAFSLGGVGGGHGRREANTILLNDAFKKFPGGLVARMRALTAAALGPLNPWSGN